MELEKIKRNLNNVVIYTNEDGVKIPYFLTACILRKDKKNQFYYEVELKDVKANFSVLICDLGKIEEKRN